MDTAAMMASSHPSAIHEVDEDSKAATRDSSTVRLRQLAHFHDSADSQRSHCNALTSSVMTIPHSLQAGIEDDDLLLAGNLVLVDGVPSLLDAAAALSPGAVVALFLFVEFLVRETFPRTIVDNILTQILRQATYGDICNSADSTRYRIHVDKNFNIAAV